MKYYLLLLLLPINALAADQIVCKAPTLRVSFHSEGCHNKEELLRASKVAIKAIIADDSKRFNDSKKEQARITRELLRTLKCE